ncbi:MAG TPA: tetratricopeptide repeat protein [Fervidobacterium sp.]|nr:tetratricopeptide repeat protein [Fervidobacterium sp.]HOM73474.1 tetratricopeptide repeat protein [Fervidobacterium sp.]HPP17377.1 tetratricopeptide repeat protein [Fervidobacterium sp.]HRD20736.1 tetratricopeptide repeat protein [Fervidobacterium sp.]
MRTNLTGSVKIIVILMVIISSFVGLPITVQEIRERSKEDPEFAWDMYLVYLSSIDNPDQFQDLGRFLYAKRKLKSYDFVVKEDVNGLIEFLKNSEFTTSGKYYLLDVFDKEFLLKYLSDNLEDNDDVLYLFKLFPERVNDYLDRIFPKLVENEQIRNYIFFKLITRRPEPEIEEFVDAFYNRLFEECKEIKDENKRQMYIDAYNAVKVLNAEKYVDDRFEKLMVFSPPDDNEKTVAGNIDESTETTTPDIQASRPIISFIKEVGLPFILLTIVIVLVFVLMIIPFTRYHLYLLFGLKGRAARVYKKIVEKDPFDEEKRLKLAQLYEEAGMYEEALSEYSFLKRIKLE